MTSKVPKLIAGKTSSAQLARAFNTLHECIDNRFDAMEGMLAAHQQTANDAVGDLARRVENIELLPGRLLRWLWGLLASIVIGIVANVGTNYVLHQQTASVAQQAVVEAKQARQASQEAAVSSQRAAEVVESK